MAKWSPELSRIFSSSFKTGSDIASRDIEEKEQRRKDAINSRLKAMEPYLSSLPAEEAIRVVDEIRMGGTPDLTTPKFDISDTGERTPVTEDSDILPSGIIGENVEPDPLLGGGAKLRLNPQTGQVEQAVQKQVREPIRIPEKAEKKPPVHMSLIYIGEKDSQITGLEVGKHPKWLVDKRFQIASAETRANQRKDLQELRAKEAKDKEARKEKRGSSGKQSLYEQLAKTAWSKYLQSKGTNEEDSMREEFSNILKLAGKPQEEIDKFRKKEIEDEEAWWAGIAKVAKDITKKINPPKKEGKTIRVREKSSGMTGSIPEDEFDSTLYERI